MARKTRTKTIMLMHDKAGLAEVQQIIHRHMERRFRITPDNLTMELDEDSQAWGLVLKRDDAYTGWDVDGGYFDMPYGFLPATREMASYAQGVLDAISHIPEEV